VTTALLPILESAVLVVAAPLCGVALATRRFRGAVPAVALFAVALAISGAATIAWSPSSATTMRLVLTSHATLAVIGLALAAFGAWLGSVCHDPLDAAALGVSAALVAALGLFAAGPLVADLPAAILNAALSANPIVAAASAADVDLLRIDLLYRISPLAHRSFEYPAWYSPLALYGAVLVVSLAATTRAFRKGWL
jgi:hypothetical protein